MSETVLGRYLIEKELGRGGMGVVFKAWDTKLDCAVALKSVLPEFAQDEGARRRILREARTAASLDHPYVCRIFDTVESGNDLYVVMEYCEGQTLEQSGLNVEEVVRAGVEVAEALEDAHAKGIVHRDLKPGNIMRTRSGHVKVMDFGLAKCVPPAAATGWNATASVTALGQVVGSTPYMSPEQIRGQTVDARSDIFSFGITLYELLTGHKPFYGSNAAETIASILTDQPEPMSRYRRGIPEGLERVILKMLQKDPAARPQSAAEVRAKLLQALQRRPEKLTLPKGLRSRKLQAGLIVGICAVVALLWYRPVVLNRLTGPPASPRPAPGEAPAALYERAMRLAGQLSHSDNEIAIRYLAQCILLDPDNAAAHSALALEKLKRFWWYQGDTRLVAEAREGAAHALKLDPGQVQAKAILAICGTLNSSDPQGYLDLAAVLREQPSQLEAIAWLATFFAKAGEFESAHQLLNRLKSARPESPYLLPLQTFLSLQKYDFAATKRGIVEMEQRYANWDGVAYSKLSRAIKLPDTTLLRQGIDDLRLTNPDDPSLRFWETYLKAAQGTAVGADELQAMTPFAEEDFELAALLAQIHARLGNREEAVKWLAHAVDHGNYDLVQMKHADFKSLESDRRFSELRNSLQEKISRMSTQIRLAVLDRKRVLR